MAAQPLLKEVAPANMLPIVVMLAVDENTSLWLKLVAPSNI